MRGTGENAEERDRLVQVVETVGGNILQQEGGDLAKVAWGLGGESLALQLDAEWVTRFVGEQNNIDQFALSRAECEGARAGGCRPGGNIERELAYGNRSSADEHASEVWEKAVGDVKTGTAILFAARLAGMVRGLQINPMGMVEEKEKRGMIYDLSLIHI